MAIKAKISVSTIKKLKVEDKRLNDTEIAGFHARISPKGSIKYYLYYRLDGKQALWKMIFSLLDPKSKMVAVTHDSSYLDHFDKVIVLD
ncbi:hypothetical protein A145_14830 [Vibrio splendidus 5S-101]|nr:Arm DNA-binding domain-containing protein [Vibrio splendidus]OEF17290.1 hypothetical protein A145_14830 [Vibrio splendidus 5S-101]